MQVVQSCIAISAFGSSGRQPRANLRSNLLVATLRSRLAVKAGMTVSLRYASTAPARSPLTFSRAGKAVATVRATAVKGANTITWTGRIGNAPAPARGLPAHGEGPRLRWPDRRDHGVAHVPAPLIGPDRPRIQRSRRSTPPTGDVLGGPTLVGARSDEVGN